MMRCLELAKKGLPSAMPNPSVGAVLVYNNQIIGEGFTSPFGGNHGEVNCIQSVGNKELISKSTLYVSLEPCSHTGKTPPCADLIVKNKIPKVVIGCVDTFSKVAGKGIQRLKENGIEVEVGVLEKECRELNKRFFTFYEKNRPYIILKWAQTKDGFVAPMADKHEKDRWISGPKTNQFTHQLRAKEMAILVGKSTVLADNPSLTTRNFPGKNPTRILFDRDLEIWNSKKSFAIFEPDTHTIILNNVRNFIKNNIQGIKLDYSKDILPQLMRNLVQRNIQSLIVEGGTRTLQSFIDKNLWDESIVITSSIEFGSGVPSPDFSCLNFKLIKLGNDEIRIYKNLDS